MGDNSGSYPMAGI